MNLLHYVVLVTKTLYTKGIGSFDTNEKFLSPYSKRKERTRNYSISQKKCPVWKKLPSIKSKMKDTKKFLLILNFQNDDRAVKK